MGALLRRRAGASQGIIEISRPRQLCVPCRKVVHDPTARHMGGVAGHAGLFSTASDFARYARMMVNMGELDGVRIVSPKTVALMASDHLPPDVQYGETARSRFGQLAPVPEMGYGFGLGFAVRKQQGMSPAPGSVGEFFWGGAASTHFWVSPTDDLAVVILSQIMPFTFQLEAVVKPIVYEAIERSGK